MSDDTKPTAQPTSLGPHVVPDEREKLIIDHVANLSETARQVSDSLPFAADVAELGGLLETEADQFGEGDDA